MNEIIWKQIEGFEGYYDVCNLGLIRSTPAVRTNKLGQIIQRNAGVMKPKMGSDGYLSISLSTLSKKKTVRINIIVAKHFIDNPENKPLVDHINGIPWDNRVENLRWATVIENINYSYGRGVNEGEKVVIQKLDFNENVLKEYASVASVSKDGYGSRVVNRVVLGQRHHAYGFKWRRIIVQGKK